VEFGTYETILLSQQLWERNQILGRKQKFWFRFGLQTIKLSIIEGGPDKFLARSGRKQATATKLRIYLTYSPRSSVHFLARCSNLCKPLKKNQNVVRPTRSSRQQWSPRRTKNGELSIAFSVQRTGCSPTGVRRGHIRRIGWVIKTLEAQVGQFLLGCKCPVSRGFVVQEQDGLGEIPSAFFLQNVLQLHQQRWIILRVDSLALWKVINEEDFVLIPKNRGENFSSGFLYSEFLRGGAGCAAMPPLHWLLFCLRVIVI